MKRNGAMIAAGLLIAALLILLQVLFIVRQGEVAVVTTLGRPVRALAEPGLFARWPWPVQRVYRYDNRTRVLSGSFEECLTQDGKNVLVSLYAGWRIRDPVKFLERVGTVAAAETSLDGLFRTYRSSLLGQVRLANLLNVDTNQLRLAEIEQRIGDAVRPEALDRYGIAVEFVGLRKLGLPEAITQSVFARMRTERQELSDRYKSEGQGEAVRIRSRADSERDQLLARAEADAKRLRAEGDAAAAEHYKTFDRNPELAMYLRKLEALEETLKEKSTVVLSTETEPYELLRRDGGATTPAAAKP